MNIVVNLNKKHNITSHDAVASVKKIFKVRKAGHAGTLDPIATGVLLVCLNEATKITRFLSDLEKEYIMTAKLGESTNTYDSEGTVIRRLESLNITDAEIERTIKKFIGEIEQVPPMYSAIKLSGRPLYELARRGIEVERKPRKVTIRAIEILNIELPFLTLKVACSKGTYIRSLCNDIGNDLGVGAYMTELVRTRIGDFSIEGSARIDELPHKISALRAIDSSLAHLQEIKLNHEEFNKAKNGNPFPLPLLRPSAGANFDGGFVRLKDPDNKLFGIGKIGKDHIKIERLFRI